MNRCLVVGNGPSLADVDNAILEQFDTFGCNHCQAKFDPDYYVFVDPAHADNPNVEFIDEIKAMRSKEKFILKEIAHLIPGSTPLNCIHRMGFSDNPLNHIFTYFSVTTAMIQLAYWMGYEKIGLVGMDHRWTTPKGKREFHTIDEDVNHFSDSYYDGYADKWKAPRMDLLDQWHITARHYIEENDRKVVNLTPGSGLKVYDFERLEDWLEQG